MFAFSFRSKPLLFKECNTMITMTFSRDGSGSGSSSISSILNIWSGG